VAQFSGVTLGKASLQNRNLWSFWHRLC